MIDETDDGSRFAYRYDAFMNRRRALAGRLLRALLIGAAVTVLLAWIAMFYPGSSHTYGPPTMRDLGLVRTTDGSAIWRLSAGRNAWHHVVTYWHVQISGRSIWMPEEDFLAQQYDPSDLPAHLQPESVDDLHMWAAYREVGWPLPALTASIHWKEQIQNADVTYSVHGGLNLGRDSDYRPLALPLRPVWPGFVINVLFWAAVWLMVTECYHQFRLERARRANRCIHCGYSRTGISSDVRCPECGHFNMDIKSA